MEKRTEEKKEFWELRMTQLIHHLEGMRIAEYIDLLQKPHKLIWYNFLGGLARGLGIAIGATLLLALLIRLLQKMIVLNVPLIGSFVAEIVRIVEQQNGHF